VVIIGSGIAGLSTAYELARFGRSVVVIDRGKIGSGMTARTTAHLATALDDLYSELIKVRSEDEARIYHDSQVAAGEPDRGDLPRRGHRRRFRPRRRLHVRRRAGAL
jgi:glycine/D-amino acid oxidase-like deaminating enzyme